ncbi:uncharacterized protein [Eleutherodactylus coqui]|uniref:uncharacterized protein n=1 Tax=Eleutherodactylus coqui TaxID=57060 RepID=UPI0034626617
MQSVRDLQHLNAISPVPQNEETQGHYSRLFLVSKPCGKHRMIVNLKPLNTCVKYRKFKMESISSTIKLITKGAYMASIDLKDAYFHVPIHEGSQRYLRLAVDMGKGIEHHQFRCLPFGISSAPRIFTKIMAEVAAYLRKKSILIIPYLDDILIIAESRKLLTKHLEIVLELLQSLGWIINWEKSSLNPDRKKMFLGITLNSELQCSCLPEEKIQKIQRLVRSFLQKRSCTIREAMSLLGSLTSCIPGVAWAQAHTRALQASILSAWDKNVYPKHSENIPALVDIPSEPAERGSLATKPSHAHHNGRKRLGMESACGEPVLSGPVVPKDKRTILQLQRATGRMAGPTAVRKLATEPAYKDTVGQYRHGRPFSAPGGHKVSCSAKHFAENLPLGRGPDPFDHGNTLKRDATPKSGLPQQEADRPRRMVSLPGGIQNPDQPVGVPTIGPICNQGERQSRQFLLPPARRSSYSIRRPRPGLRKGASVRISSDTADPQGLTTFQNPGMHAHPGDPLLAQEKLVRSSDNIECPGPSHLSDLDRSAITGATEPPGLRQTPLNSMALEESSLRGKGFSQRVVETLMSSRKKTTHLIYQKVWRRFSSWRQGRDSGDSIPSIPLILEFLQEGLQMGRRSRSQPLAPYATQSSRTIDGSTGS